MSGPRLIGLSAALIAFVVEWSIVVATFAGDWTGLFHTGSLSRIDTALVGERLAVSPGGHGYDGQYYHLIAHDPFMKRGLEKQCDAPRLRYRRILVPLLGSIGGVVHKDWIDPALHAANIGFIALGAYWAAILAMRAGRSHVWGLLTLLSPAVIIGMPRFLVDIPIQSLALGCAVYAGRSPRLLYLLLATAPLVRDTGALLAAGWCAYLLWNRRWKEFGVYATCAIPVCLWWWWVQTRTADFVSHLFVGGDMGSILMRIPVAAFIGRFFEPFLPPEVHWISTATDYVSLVGVAIALVLIYLHWFRNRHDPAVWIVAALASMVPIAGGGIGWYDPLGYPRVLSPWIAMLAFDGVLSRRWLHVVPLVMMLPRIAIQFAPDMLAVVRWLI